jgi:lysozyme
MPRDIQMTPGNKDPLRYRKTTLSVAMVALIAAGASAPQLFGQFLDEKEGNRLVSYQDGVGIWTICRGLTRIDGRKVLANMRLTEEQCKFYNEEHSEEAMGEMAKRVKRWPELSEPAKAGIASFCWTNIGWEKCKASTFMRLLEGGAPANEYCAQITNWIRDAGRDCRRAGSNCQGQPIRRMQEDELCLIPQGAEL